MENKDLIIVREQIAGMKEMIDSTVVTNGKELEEISDKIKKVKFLLKIVKDKKEKYVEPAKQIISEARETYDPMIKECENAEEVLKQKAKVYMLDVEKKEKEAQDKIAARVEKGTLKPETAMRKLEAMPEAPKTVRSDTGSALRMSKRKVAKILNLDNQQKMLAETLIHGLEKIAELDGDNKRADEIKNILIPPEYWVIDEVRVRKEALEKDKNGLPQIPGVVISEEADLASL